MIPANESRVFSVMKESSMATSQAIINVLWRRKAGVARKKHSSNKTTIGIPNCAVNVRYSS